MRNRAVSRVAVIVTATSTFGRALRAANAAAAYGGDLELVLADQFRHLADDEVRRLARRVLREIAVRGEY